MHFARNDKRQRPPDSIRRPCILVADDDRDILAMVSVALRSDGYDVVEAKTGAELLDHVGSAMLFRESYTPPDMIVCDIRMPGFTGLEVVAGLRAANWHTPCVLITAYGDESTQAEAKRLGVSAIFNKPFDIDDLRTAVLNLLPIEAWSHPPKSSPQPPTA